MQVILHNGSHYRGITVVNNQNVLYDGKINNEFKSIADTEKFASEETGGNYSLPCLLYIKVLNGKGPSSYSLPVFPTFMVLPPPTHGTKHDKIHEEATCETKKTDHSKGGTIESDELNVDEEASCKTKIPSNQKRARKPKQIYTPPSQSTPKPPKRP